MGYIPLKTEQITIPTVQALSKSQLFTIRVQFKVTLKAGGNVTTNVLINFRLHVYTLIPGTEKLGSFRVGTPAKHILRGNCGKYECLVNMGPRPFIHVRSI
jgi:hypothetical protein